MADKERKIAVSLATIDHYHKTWYFKTLDGARKRAHYHVGPTPEISESFCYAISGDGVARIMVRGATLAEIFPDCYPQPVQPGPDDDPDPDGAMSGYYRDGYWHAY